MARRVAFLALLPLLAACAAAPETGRDADLILTNARIWTADDDAPRAEAVAIRGERILAVGDARAVRRYAGPATEMIDLGGRFVTPGFIDNHTHFNSAGALLLGANLLDVADEAGFVQRVREARDRLPAGAWIVGGDWGAYEDWEMGATGREQAQQQQRFLPHRSMIDSITPGTPALLSRWDRSVHLANGAALEAAGVTCAWDGVECDAAGNLTGRLASPASARVRQVIPRKSMEQLLMEARIALEQLAELGVTTIHDNTPASAMAVFQELLNRGELTTRIYARPTLDRWEHLAAIGIRHGYGNDWLRIGGLKGHVDGILGNSTARFYEPYEHIDGTGSWRPIMSPPGNMERHLRGADAAGHWPQVHAIGDLAIDTLLTMYEEVMRVNGPADRRFRIIHVQHIRDAAVAERMARLGVIAEVQPYHAIDDMRWVEERIGERRARWTYAFRTLADAGVLLSFGSDWPGTNASWYPANAMQGIYAAVTRQTLDGEPEGGWFPEERVDLDTALRAYTINNAFAEGQEHAKGSITAGKLADIAVLDRDPFEIPPLELKDVRVVLTLVGGRIVHDARDAVLADQ